MTHLPGIRSARGHLGLVMSLGLLVGCRGNDDHHARAKHTKPVAVEFDLSHGIAEGSSPGLLRSADATMLDWLQSVREVESDGNARGLWVRLGSVRLGWAQGAEMVRGVQRLRGQGKKVFCHADDLSNGTYAIAAASCDQIWLSPAGSVETVGLGAELVFAKELLQKLNVTADILQVGKYKGTGEMFTRDAASDEVKESLGGLLGDLRTKWLTTAEQSRKKDGLRIAMENGPHTPEQAKTIGLIDQIGYGDEARLALERDLSVSSVEPGYQPNREKNDGGIWGIVRGLGGGSRHKESKPHVALLRAHGAISMEAGGGLLGSDGGIRAKALSKQLRALADNDAVKVVVLRIDSPGGSALASDLLWHELMLVRARKPLVVSVGDMAASGGYYMACAGSKIVAEEASILGSIGVVGGKLAFGPALRPLGVHVETLTASGGAKGNDRASYNSALTPWDAPTRAKVLASMQSVYDLFVHRVMSGRNLSQEQVQGFAEGRVFSGREGKAKGMVDELGGLESALTLARSEAHLPADAPVQMVQEEGGLLDLLGFGGSDDDDEESKQRSLVRSVTGELMQSVGVPSALFSYVGAMAPLLESEHTLAAMPFAILIR